MPLSQLVVLCRLGFEAEAAQELIERAAEFDVELTRDDEPQQAFVVLHARSGDTGKLVRAIDFRSLVFARQWFACDELIELPRQDRLTVLMDAARALGTFGNVWFETADTNDAKALGSLGQALYKPFSSLVKKEGLWQPGTQARLHVMLTSGTTAYIGVSYPPNSSAAMGGIPRLKVPREAPSRSATKLDEAIHWFLDEGKKSDHPSLFVPGSWAVDLGAAPGGWTFQLVQRGINVMAVDNGPMNPELMNSGFVRHYKQDGYTFQPPKPVAWMVCDIADKPARTIDMVAEWLTKGWCQRTIFNLKLPMKQRYAEVQHLLSRLSHKVAHQLPQAQLTLAAKQLYHNREEITVYASIFVKK